MEGKSPLEDLLVDAGEIDEFLLRDLLKPYVQIEKQGGNLFFTADFDKLNLRQKILVVLLAQKAKFRLGYTSSERLPPKDLELLLGAKGGSIRPALKDLRQFGLIAGEKGEYYVPNAAIFKVKSYLLKGG